MGLSCLPISHKKDARLIRINLMHQKPCEFRSPMHMDGENCLFKGYISRNGQMIAHKNIDPMGLFSTLPGQDRLHVFQYSITRFVFFTNKRQISCEGLLEVKKKKRFFYP